MYVGPAETTAKSWEHLTSVVLNLEKISLPSLQAVLKETYFILSHMSKETHVPKSVCKMLLSMDEFLYFSSLIEKNENQLNFYHYQFVSCIADAMKKVFFDGECEESYPKLRIRDLNKEEFVVNFDENIFM